MAVVGEVNLVTDSTMQDIAASLRKMAGVNIYQPTSMAEIKKLVATGNAKNIFSIGDQINVPWTDKEASREYTIPFDVVHHGTATLKTGEVVPAMYLQSHYAIPFGVQFSAAQAFHVVKDSELQPGTYNVIMGEKWGTHVVQNKTYQFTLTKPVPINGQLAGFRGAPDQAPANWKVYTYKDNATKEPIETVNVTEGAAGTNLGTLISAGNNLNSLHKVAYGNNRWAHSAMRQWLNSEQLAGKWWKPQNEYDRVPDQENKAGFLSGFKEDFLNALMPVKVTTALNTKTDASVGVSEDTYDKFFLPGLEQMYIEPEWKGEGEAWDYWKRVLGRIKPVEKWKTYPELITYRLDAKTSPQHVRLRSANRGAASNSYYVTSAGTVSYGTASGANTCAPACVIVGI